MTETADSTDDPEPGAPSTENAASAAPVEDDDRDVVTWLYWGALGVLGLLAAVALLQFYSSASTAIGVWVADRFEPVIQAAFNLVVLLAAAAGISLVVRELRE